VTGGTELRSMISSGSSCPNSICGDLDQQRHDAETRDRQGEVVVAREHLAPESRSATRTETCAPDDDSTSSALSVPRNDRSRSDDLGAAP
jgi:hypothetical protein